jgi:hypothetical protein
VQPVDSITFSFFQEDTNIVTSLGGYKYWDCDLQFYNYGINRDVAWVGNKIYRINPFGYFEVDTAFHLTVDSTFCPINYAGLWLGADDSGKKFLSINQRFTIATSLGFLLEYEPETGVQNTLLDTIDSNISSAEYFGEDTILYYSYGPSYSQSNQTPSDAGYYFYDRKTGKTTMILPYLSEIGPDEMVNGFDISPDRKELLLPVIPKTDPPYLIEYDLTTGVKRTYPVFNGFNGNWSLWARYSHDGKQILYDLYPVGSFGSAFGVFYGSETGIIDRLSFSRRVINTNPTNEGTWITVFPQWSPDDQQIIYLAGAISIEPPGAVSESGIYILKKF